MFFLYSLILVLLIYWLTFFSILFMVLKLGLYMIKLNYFRFLPLNFFILVFSRLNLFQILIIVLFLFLLRQIVGFSKDLIANNSPILLFLLCHYYKKFSLSTQYGVFIE